MNSRFHGFNARCRGVEVKGKYLVVLCVPRSSCWAAVEDRKLDETGLIQQDSSSVLRMQGREQKGED